MSKHLKTLHNHTLLFMTGVLSIASQADAAFTLKLVSSGGTTVVVDDDGLLDLNPQTGAISYSAAIDNFVVQLTGAVKTSRRGPNIAELDLTSQTLASVAGTLTITLSDSHFLLATSTGNAILTSHIGGTTPGETYYQSYVDTNNLFGISGPGVYTSDLQGPFTGPFGGTATKNSLRAGLLDYFSSGNYYRGWSNPKLWCDNCSRSEVHRRHRRLCMGGSEP